MTTLEILEKARAAIADEGRWCVGNQLRPDGRRCALGAVHTGLGHTETHSRYYSSFIFTDGNMPIFNAICQLLADAIPDENHLCDPVNGGFDTRGAGAIARYNNTHTHAEVLAWFDRAIARQRTLESLLASAHPPAEAEKLRTAEPVI
jgi:hypothetical protein